MPIKAIETRYAGCRFRSRLEARWAVFFNYMNIPWEYEPQGYVLSDGRHYLPDFRLPDCGTWVEVKGDPARVDLDLIHRAAQELPHSHHGGEPCDGVLILGSIPDVSVVAADPAWTLFGRGEYCGLGWPGGHYGFSTYPKNRRPWMINTGVGPNFDDLTAPVLENDESEVLSRTCRDAYKAARSARFEHGERG